MKKYKLVIILANLLLLLVIFNLSVFKKENILEEGKLILLRLAPVDPRSLMQGDYMSLRYEIASDIDPDSIPKRGYCVVKLDSNVIAKKLRFQKERTPLNEKEYLIEYTINDYRLNIGAESFFFEEGQSEKFSKAKFGGIKTDEKGNSVLTGLYDEKLKLIQ